MVLCITINRFYTRLDLERTSALTSEQISFMSKNEVFETNCKSKITSDMIIDKCYVWTIEEYDREPRVGLEVYYTRASYDIVLVRFIITLENTRSSNECLGTHLRLLEAIKPIEFVYRVRWMS